MRTLNVSVLKIFLFAWCGQGRVCWLFPTG